MTHMTTTPTPTGIPALDIPLNHVHLIEASAGTGKTWTLAALVVRLLVEDKRSCEQIIATTFTRAAAAEMRERIRGRIHDTKTLISQVLIAFPDIHQLNQMVDADVSSNMEDTNVGNVDVSVTDGELATLPLKQPDTSTQIQTAKTQTKPKPSLYEPDLFIDSLFDEQNLFFESLDLQDSFAEPANDHAINIDSDIDDDIKVDTQIDGDIQIDINGDIEIDEKSTPNNVNHSDEHTPLDSLFVSIATHLKKHALNHSHLLDDPLNEYLLKFLLQEEQKNQESEDVAKKTGLLWAQKHLEMTLIQLDHLFIGTLDSLCQKLLHEFAFDLLINDGYTTPLTIAENSDDTVTRLTHDAVRIWRTHQHQHNPQLMTLLAESGKLTPVDDFLGAVNKSLNFIAEPLLAVETVQIDTAQIDDLVISLEEADDELTYWFNRNGENFQYFYKGRRFYRHGQCWASLKQKIIQYKLSVLNYLSDAEQSLFDAFLNIRTNFKPSAVDAIYEFEMLNVVYTTTLIREIIDGLEVSLEKLREHQNYFVCDYVRKNLPTALEAQGKTSFALQLRLLNKALASSMEQSNPKQPNSKQSSPNQPNSKQSSKVKSLAQQIRYRYPVALIDEFQDVNADQAGMIHHIYQQGLKENALKKGCLLLVGDPKQAIYGFRGGDVYNYQKLKKTIPSKHHHTLDTNRRSQTALIEKLNTFFGSQPTLLEEVKYEPVNAFGVDEVILDEHNQPIKNLLRHLSLDSIRQTSQETDKDDANQKDVGIASVLASKIAHLLATHKMRDADNRERALVPDDIAVLYKSRWDIVGLEHQLHQRNIATFMGASDSVFVSTMAEDMASVMQAMLSPYHIATLRRALVAKFFGLTQNQLIQLLDEEKIAFSRQADTHTNHNSKAQGNIENAQVLMSFGDIQFAFAEAGKTWQKFGFLAGWQQLAKEFDLWQKMAQLPEGERYLVDVRHLLEIIQSNALQNEQNRQNQSNKASNVTENALLTWFLTQLTEKPTDDWALARRLPSASGVQMMTIHKSKGLEFPIVFVVGVDKPSRLAKKTKDIFLTFASHEKTDSSKTSKTNNSKTDSSQINKTSQKNQHSSPKPQNKIQTLATDIANFTNKTNLKEPIEPLVLTTKSGKDDCHLKANNDRQYAEDIRVNYVAFTRPSQLLYLVTTKSLMDSVIKDSNNQTTAIKNSLSHWLVKQTDFRADIASVFSKDNVADLDIKLPDNAQSNAQTDATGGDIATLDAIDTITLPPPAPNKTAFYPWQKTSFTALSRELAPLEESLAIDLPDHHDALLDVDSDTKQLNQVLEKPALENKSLSNELLDGNHAESIHANPLRFCFPKGANSGSFLHKIFEKLDFSTLNHRHHWSWFIKSIAEQFGLAQEFERHDMTLDDTAIATLSDWIVEVLQTPLSSGATLANLPANQRLPEMGFSLGLQSQFSAPQLSQLMQSQGFHIHLPEQKKWFRFLQGEIDLIYAHQDKYYVLDYKSNFLGDDYASYCQANMQEAMNHAGYWLQAAIYLVALHRYLKLRLTHYDPDVHLGGVEYAFLRGMHPEKYEQHNAGKQQTGVIFWQPDVSFVLALDALFG